LPYGQPRCPPERANASRIQKNKGIVADPPTITAGVFEFRTDAKLLGDPADRIVHAAILVGSEVERVHFVARVRHCEEYRVYAVLPVEGRLALGAVGGHPEARG